MTMTKFKVIIAGSRELTMSPEAVFSRIENLTGEQKHIEVVSGTARGGDKLGESWANKQGHQIKRFPAEWNRFGLSAGFRRNEQMADYADALIAIWDGKSKGTNHMINVAKNRKLPVRVIRMDKFVATP